MCARLPGREEAAVFHISRQRVLLERLFEVIQEQRRYLIAGDIAGLGRTSHWLGELLGQQQALSERSLGTVAHSKPQRQQIERLRQLTQQLQNEGRINYLLACRGAQFAEFMLSLACGKHQDDEEAAAALDTDRLPHLVDTCT